MTLRGAAVEDVVSELIILCLHSAYDTNEDTHQSWGRRSLCSILALFRMLEALLQNAFIPR